VNRITLPALWLVTAVLPAQTNTNRTLTVINQCRSTVRIGVNGSFVQDCAGTDQSCPAGTACLTTRTPPGCFWTLPEPSHGSMVLQSGGRASFPLNAPPINETVTIHGVTTTVNVKWSGNIYAAAGCDKNGNNCTTGMCPQSVNGKSSLVPCPSGTGPQGTVTLAEFTFSSTGADFYDISVINGVNVPISMAPASVTSQPGANAYFCRIAGSTAASPTGLQACTWRFQPPPGERRFLAAVAPGGAPCPPSGRCVGTGEVCGLPVHQGTTTDLPLTCGKQVGWWTADEVCAVGNNAFGAPFNCSSPVAGQGQQVNLYACNGANATSCFQPNPGPSCCGCPNWTVNNQPLITSMSCNRKNPSWASIAQPFAAFVKNACPTAYSFPFDDATSTFTCNTPNVSPTEPNQMNYTITFCPGGKAAF